MLLPCEVSHTPLVYDVRAVGAVCVFVCVSVRVVRRGQLVGTSRFWSVGATSYDKECIYSKNGPSRLARLDPQLPRLRFFWFGRLLLLLLLLPCTADEAFSCSLMIAGSMAFQ